MTGETGPPVAGTHQAVCSESSERVRFTDVHALVRGGMVEKHFQETLQEGVHRCATATERTFSARLEPGRVPLFSMDSVN